MKRHIVTPVIAVLVVAVEVWAFMHLMDWAERASTSLGDQTLILSVTAVLLAPLLGVAIVWYLEHTPPEKQL